jgi:hypothetical protein
MSHLIMLEAEWRICSSDISLQAADMPCSNSAHILEIYKSLLSKDVSENYQSTRLQCKLASYYGSSVTIHPQRGQGMSSIVFSSSLTIADAIAKATS